MKRNYEEGAIQKAIVDYLHLVLPPSIRVVAVSNNPRNRVVGGIEKGRGLSKGFPDLILLGSVTGLLEVKRKGQKLRPDQVDWARWAITNGVRHVVVRSIDDVRAVLDDWGIVTRDLTGRKLEAE